MEPIQKSKDGKTEEDIAAHYVLDLMDDLKTIVKNKTNDRNIRFLIIAIDDETGMYQTDGNLCQLCARDTLIDEINTFNLKHVE